MHEVIAADWKKGQDWQSGCTNMVFVVASTVPLRAVHRGPSSDESGWCKSKERDLCQGGRRISQPHLQPVNRSEIRSLSPILRLSSGSPSFYISSSPASPVGRSRSLLKLQSPPCTSFSSSPFLNSLTFRVAYSPMKRVGTSRTRSPDLCRSSLLTREQETITEEAVRPEEGGGNGGNNRGGGGGGGGGGGNGDAIDWISSALVFAFWAGLIIYAWTLAPNQTQYRDIYFVQKLVNLRGDDGFVMNKVLVAEFYIMGLWPLIYAALLIPSGRSRKNGAKVWPFSVASFFVGAFALLPYFGLWRPPPPAVSRDELSRFPLNILESKITAVAAIVGGIVLFSYAGFAGAEQWTEFIQYFRESKFIHIMSIDFVTLSTLAPFWVYNDLSVRQGSDKASWLVPFSVIPYFGPALYLYLRPPLPSAAISDGSQEISDTSASS